MRFSDLTAGYEFPAAPLALDAATVAVYLAAVEDDADVYWRGDTLLYAPPLAAAALAFQGIARGLALDPGSLHTGQELAFRRPVRVGERLTAQARVAMASKRRGFTALILDTVATDDMAEEALTGRMTLMVSGSGQGGLAEAGSAGGRAPEVPAADAAPIEHVAYPPLEPSSIVAGLALPELTRTVTQGRIDAYALASGDHNPIHLDPDFAARTPFGGTIAHGMLLLAYVSTALTHAFGRAWLDTGTLKARFRNPAPAGTVVTARGMIERVEESDGARPARAVCAVRLDDAAGEALITGEARVDITIR